MMMWKRTISCTFLLIACFTASVTFALARRGGGVGNHHRRRRQQEQQLDHVNHRKDLEWTDDDDHVSVANDVITDDDKVTIARPFHSFSMSCKNPKKGWCSFHPSAAPSARPSPSPSNVASSTPTVSPKTSAPSKDFNVNVPTTRAPTRLPTTLPTTKTPTISPTKTPTAQPRETTYPPIWLPTVAPPTPSERPTPIFYHYSKAPSEGPIATLIPTKNPTPPPTFPPTLPPTPPPTFPPTLPPTPLPTLPPTPPPTPAPTLPLATPAPSTRPPTRMPTRKPTKPPSNAPTTRPPTKQPTLLPTASPTSTASNTPTNSPTLASSSFPTDSIVETKTFGNGTLTSCNTLPTADGTTKPQLLAFKYNLYLSLLADTQAALEEMELKLHLGLVSDLLLCDYESDQDYYITAIFSNPVDSLSDEPCEISNDPIPPQESNCFVVIAELSMTAFFPTLAGATGTISAANGSNRQLQETKAEEPVLIHVGDYLETSMANGDFVGNDIVQVSFQGFVYSQEVDDDDDDDSTTVSEANIESTNTTLEKKNKQIAIGSSVAMLLAMCVTIVAVLSLQRKRRRNQRDAYIKHLEDISTGENDSNSGVERTEILADGKVHLVMLDDFDDWTPPISEGSPLPPPDESPPPSPPVESNVHYCTSATCGTCRHRVFSFSEMMMDLCNSTSVSDDSEDGLTPRNQRRYLAPDTVIL